MIPLKIQRLICSIDPCYQQLFKCHNVKTKQTITNAHTQEGQPPHSRVLNCKTLSNFSAFLTTQTFHFAYFYRTSGLSRFNSIQKILTVALPWGWPTFSRNCLREHEIVSKNLAPSTARLAGARLGPWKAGQERQAGLGDNGSAGS